nr:hypothetical protein Iba_chr11aCG14140 [Ipomoea batatas]GME15299.1 hypothetical protein Iba_scaffold16065CG0040 [Ipomoea batatas]
MDYSYILQPQSLLQVLQMDCRALHFQGSRPSPSASPPAADSSLSLPIDEELRPPSFFTMTSPRCPPTENSGDLYIGIHVIPVANYGSPVRQSSELLASNSIGKYKAYMH